MPTTDQDLWVKRVLGIPTATGTGAPAGQDVAAGSVVFAKSRLAWLGARAKMKADVDRLKGAILAHYAGRNIENALGRTFDSKVAPMLDALDEQLADDLDAARNASDPAVRADLVEDARATIARYEAFLSQDTILAAMDANPLVTLSLRKPLAQALSAIDTTLR